MVVALVQIGAVSHRGLVHVQFAIAPIVRWSSVVVVVVVVQL